MAGAVMLARVDRHIGAKSQLTKTWLISSKHMDDQEWLRLEQQRWSIENGAHHTLDVTHREDESRVRHSNATAILGIFRRISNALKQAWAKGRSKREATARDWIEENQFNRWRGINLILRPIFASKTS